MTLNPGVSSGELYKYLVPFGDKISLFPFWNSQPVNELGPMFCWITFSGTFLVDHSDRGLEENPIRFVEFVDESEGHPTKTSLKQQKHTSTFQAVSIKP